MKTLIFRFRLEDFNLAHLPHQRLPNISELFEHSYFWRSDNSRFWYYVDEKGFSTMGAVLLTDTGRPGFKLGMP